MFWWLLGFAIFVWWFMAKIAVAFDKLSDQAPAMFDSKRQHKPVAPPH